MKEYDSILKEKKKYEEPTPQKEKGPKKFPWLQLDILCIILILVISYAIYYNKILSPEQIFLTDLKKITTEYQEIFKYLDLEKLNQDYNMEGTINLEEKEYNFGIVKNEDKTKIDLSLKDSSLSYYVLSNNKYIKLSSLNEEYIQLTGNDYSNIIYNLKKYKTEKDKFIKKFYLDGTTPIVESDLILNDEDIKSILGLTNLKDSYELIFTFKNNAITNNVISMKITINNLTTGERGVILYENSYITYKDDKQNLKFQLEKKEEDFTLKIYKEDTLFSVLTGTKHSNSYEYMYQIIDKIYNIKLTITDNDSNYLYKIESNIEKDGVTNNKKINITLEFKDNIILERNDITSTKNYQDLTKEEQDKYKASLEALTNDLRKLVDEYK